MQLKLTKGLTNIAINPLNGAQLSTDGQPKSALKLVQYLPYPVIGFKVPQGVKYTVNAGTVVQFKFYTDAAGTIQIAPGDTIALYAKTPSDTPTSLGTRIAEAPYRPWWEVKANLQGVGQFSTGLQFPIEETFFLEPNYTLIIAVATLISGETFNWTNSVISIPVDQSTSQF